MQSTDAKTDHETDGSRLLLELAGLPLTRKHFSKGWNVSLNIPQFSWVQAALM